MSERTQEPRVLVAVVRRTRAGSSVHRNSYLRLHYVIDPEIVGLTCFAPSSIERKAHKAQADATKHTNPPIANPARLRRLRRPPRGSAHRGLLLRGGDRLHCECRPKTRAQWVREDPVLCTRSVPNLHAVDGDNETPAR